jgi:hypothetical protein
MVTLKKAQFVQTVTDYVKTSRPPFDDAQGDRLSIRNDVHLPFVLA